MPREIPYTIVFFNLDGKTCGRAFTDSILCEKWTKELKEGKLFTGKAEYLYTKHVIMYDDYADGSD